MTYPATVIEVMLASPGDVKEERVVARKVIAQWNAEHSRDARVALLTMGWETHAGSDVPGRRAQALINDSLVVHADLMIGIFWTRLGSPTGRANSGTVEEIKMHHRARKPLMLYFSDAPLSPSAIDATQHQDVQRFRDWARKQGYIGSFSSVGEFQETFRRDLTLMLKNDERMRTLVVQAPDDGGGEKPLSPAADDLLKKIGQGSKGLLTVQNKNGSLCLMSGSDVLVESDDTVSILKWRGVVEELVGSGYVVDKTGRGQLFELAPKALTVLATS